MGAQRSTVVAACALVWLGLGALPAGADEYRLALVADLATEQGRDARDGFRLAVDQSPDVSHVPGPEAGDHLGGSDVDVLAVDGGSPAAAAKAVRRELAGGLPVVLVVASAATEQAVADAVAGSPALLLVGRTVGPASGSPGLLLTSRSGGGADDDFRAAFRAAYGRLPSPAAARGYDAGRLLDAAVADAPGGVQDRAGLVRAAQARQDVLVASELTVPPEVTAPPETPRDWRWPLAALAGLVLVAAAAVVRRRAASAG